MRWFFTFTNKPIGAMQEMLLEKPMHVKSEGEYGWL
jgi:hypothetical protein